jgi:hypothetical protein
MRGLCFCVSVAHAEFMARFCNEHELPSLALSANSSDTDRRAAQSRLRAREINLLFVVDLYNEGVDIPEIDTVVFLRPTESLTVFLQQFGRGLRLCENKECLTVLDFIGAQRREFRFAPRFRAVSTTPSARLDREIESGFPHLPPGCSVQLERVAQQHVLQNVRESLSLRRSRVIEDLRQLSALLNRAPTLAEAIDSLDATLEELLKRGLWSRLLQEAGQGEAFTEPDEERLAKGLRRLSHIDDSRLIHFLLAHLEMPRSQTSVDEMSQRRLAILHVSLWGPDGVGWSIEQAEMKLRENPVAMRDLIAILQYRLAHTTTRLRELDWKTAGPLSPHATYTRDEALVGLGHWSMIKRPDFREGALHLERSKVDAFFVTLDKTVEAYSPTTMYEDYAISEQLFHFQSQSTTSSESATGQRYVRHKEMGYTPLLFVRENKYLPSGLAAPYAFLGPAEHVSHEGSRPISIIWKLKHPMPPRLVRATARQRVG